MDMGIGHRMDTTGWSIIHLQHVMGDTEAPVVDKMPKLQPN